MFRLAVFAAICGVSFSSVANGRPLGIFEQNQSAVKNNVESENAEFEEFKLILLKIFQTHFRVLTTEQFVDRIERGSESILQRLHPSTANLPLPTIQRLLEKHVTARIQRDAFEVDRGYARFVQNLLGKGVTTGQVWDAIVNGVLEQMDPYSELFSGQSLIEYKERHSGKRIGIGISYKADQDGYPVILDVQDLSPAGRVGIELGDKLVSIRPKGQKKIFFQKLSEDDVDRALTGPLNSKLELEVRKIGGRIEKVSIVRKEYKANYVRAQPTGNGIIYFYVSRFERGVADELQKKMEFYKEARGIHLDLRGNPGGYVDEARRVVDLFISTGLVAGFVDRKGNFEEGGMMFADSPKEYSQPMVVQINDLSASASEIVAQSLSRSDYGRAVLVGRPSYGKGSAQGTEELASGKLLKMTRWMYVTRSGRSPQHRGIIPDYAVPDPWLDQLHKIRQMRLAKGEATFQIREADYPYTLPPLQLSDESPLVQWAKKNPTNPIQQVLTSIPAEVVNGPLVLPTEDTGLNAATLVLKELIKRCPTYRVDGCRVPRSQIATR
jgi:carboxyl-terminal processing protease